MSEQAQPPEPLVQHHQSPSHYSHPQYNQQQWPASAGDLGIPPAVRGRGFFRKHGKLLGLLVGAFIIAGGLGVGIGRATFDPQVITRTETKTEYQTVTKEVTPKDCITALDLAGDAVGSMADLSQIAKDGIVAAAGHDTYALNSVTERLKSLNSRMDKQNAPLGAAVSSCRLKVAS